jgi:hypothetical protein
MKIHRVKLLTQFAATFFTHLYWVFTDFLQDLYNALAFFTLVFIYGHSYLPAIALIVLLWFFPPL